MPGAYVLTLALAFVCGLLLPVGGGWGILLGILGAVVIYTGMYSFCRMVWPEKFKDGPRVK